MFIFITMFDMSQNDHRDLGLFHETLCDNKYDYEIIIAASFINRDDLNQHWI